MWYFGLFIFAGTIIKIAFDYFDKGMSTNISTPEGKKTWGSWILGMLVSSLFFAVNIITTLTDYATNDWALAVFLVCFSFVGYLAPHLYLKGTSWFARKTDEKLQ